MTEPYRFRDASGDIILDEALGEKDARHYIRILTSSSEVFSAMQLAAAAPDAPPDYAEQTWRAWQETEPVGALPGGQLLVREGTGPDTASSTRVLAPYPQIIWDVCRYYRNLGFHWSEFRSIGAKQVRERYLTLDPRQEHEELFYAAKQLLDPVIRRAYDAQPLGGLFLGDRDVRRMLERRAALEAARQTAANLRDGLDFEEPVRQADVLRGWGFDKEGVSAEEARERLASSALGATLEASWERAWSWYVLVQPGQQAAAPAPPGLLEAWQQMVCAALSEAGVTVRFSVGYHPGGNGARSWHDSKQPCIFFIGDEPPSRALAGQAVREYLG